MWVSGASGRVLVLIKLVFVIPTAPCYATRREGGERNDVARCSSESVLKFIELEG